MDEGEKIFAIDVVDNLDNERHFLLKARDEKEAQQLIQRFLKHIQIKHVVEVK